MGGHNHETYEFPTFFFSFALFPSVFNTYLILAFCSHAHTLDGFFFFSYTGYDTCWMDIHTYKGVYRSCRLGLLESLLRDERNQRGDVRIGMIMSVCLLSSVLFGLVLLPIYPLSRENGQAVPPVCGIVFLQKSLLTLAWFAMRRRNDGGGGEIIVSR